MDTPHRNSMTPLGLQNGYLAAVLRRDEIAARRATVQAKINGDDLKSVDPKFERMSRVQVEASQLAAATKAVWARVGGLAGVGVAGVEFVLIPTTVGFTVSMVSCVAAIGAGAFSEANRRHSDRALKELSERQERKFVDPYDLELRDGLSRELDEASASLAARTAELPPAGPDDLEIVEQIFRESQSHEPRDRGISDDDGMGL